MFSLFLDVLMLFFNNISSLSHRSINYGFLLTKIYENKITIIDNLIIAANFRANLITCPLGGE